MSYLKQFGIILAISFVGEILHYILPLPVPASIYGIVILFALLETKVLKLESVKDTALFLIKIMPVMFIPPAAGVLNVWGVIKSSFAAYFIVAVLSTIVVMAVSGRITQFVVRKTGKERQ